MMVSPTGSGPTDRTPTPPPAAGEGSSAARTTAAATGALAGAGGGVAASLAGRVTITYAELDARLEVWVRAGAHAPRGKRDEAKAKILDCFKNSRTDLNLSGLELTTLPIELGNISQLKSLDLTGNQLTTVPAELGNLSQLEALFLCNNHLRTVPVELGNLSQLKELDLGTNLFTAVPASLSNFSRLEILRLNRNQLTTVPASLGNMSQLKYLELNNNQLTTVPAELGNLSQLEDLRLFDNQLTTLPIELGNFSKLKHFELGCNRLTTVPAELGNLSQLVRLRLSNNRLSNIPSSFSRLSNLLELNLSHNLLPSLPDALLTDLTALTTIDAYRNRFSPAYAATLRARLDALEAMGRSVPSVEFDVYDAPMAGAGTGARIDAVGRAIMTLPEAISFWEAAAGATAKPADFWSPLEEGKAELESFLTRQRNTANFKNGNEAEKSAFAGLLIKLLNEMATNEDFRTVGLTEIGHSNSTCDDREAYGLDKLATAWETLIGTKGKSELEVAAFALGLARKAMIEEEAAKLGGDPIETALRLQIALKDTLKLPTATQKMLYAAIASVSDAGALAVGATILAATNTPVAIARALIAQPVWQERLRALDEEERYEKVVAEVTGGTYANEDVRKGQMAARLDELYLADTARWMEAHFDELKPLI